MNCKTNLTQKEMKALNIAYNALNKEYNMNPENDLKEITNDEIKRNIINIFQTEEEYINWGIETLGEEAIECEQSFNEGQSQADAISEIEEQARMIITYKIGGKIIQIENQLEELVEWG
jgi:hypothetical protein